MSPARDPKAPLTLDEFLSNLQELRKLGPITKVLKLLPGELGQLAGSVDEQEVIKLEAILSAMTVEERRNPDLLLELAPRHRIAERSGQPVEQVNQLLAEFKKAQRWNSGDASTPT